MTAGVLLGGVCFAITLAAEVLGMATDGGPMADLPALADGLLAFRPWAWASLGTYVVVATPVISLGATAIEYAMVHDRRSTGLALLVVAVLALSGLVAWLG
jgi:uncharacterized membrane protein